MGSSLTFDARHGPFELQPSEDVASKCDDCDAVLIGSDGQMWLGRWVK